ncbi:hypothetical protein KQI52_05035 [bacterium]|nr:hypothetical protein [bacterium]
MNRQTTNYQTFWTLTSIIFALMLSASLLWVTACSSTDENDESSPTGPGGTGGMDGTFWLVDLEMQNDLAFVTPVERVLPGDKVYLFKDDTLHIKQKGDFHAYPIEIIGDTLFIDWNSPNLEPQPFLMQTDGDTIRITPSGQDPDFMAEVFVKRPADLDRDDLDEELRASVEAFWADPAYRELEYLVAADPDKVSAGQVYTGTRDEWAALEWSEKRSYLPWTFAFPLERFPGDDLAMYEYCRNIVIQPEQFGYMWSDWLEDKTPSEVMTAARENDYKWPGGSSEFAAILELYDTAWTYPEE